jgi:YVTN family beta-propeller protein
METVSKYFFILIFFSTTLCLTAQNKNDLWIVSAPAGSEYTHINRQGKTVIPNGRYITPLGKTIETAPHPYGLALSHDGNTAVTANSGVRPLSITIIRDLLSENPDVKQIPKKKTKKGVLASVFMGLAFSPDDKTIYVSGGEENKVYLFDARTGKKKGFIDCSYQNDSLDYTDGYIGDLKLTKDGSRLYAVDQIGFRVVVVNTRTKKVIHNIPVGRYPFGLTLSPDEKKLYVANVGMFQYALIKENDSDTAKIKPIPYPAFGYGTEAMKNGIHNDSVYIPGLGDPNVPESFSVFTVDLTDPDKPEVTAKIKTGTLVGAMIEGFPAVGGSSPNSIVATGQYVFVSNGNNDNISVISTEKDTVVATIPLHLDRRMNHFRGIIPFGLALSPDGKRLYVAESGINAVGVVSIPEFKVLGHIPAGWFPSKLQVTPNGKKLIIANAKGYGSGPNTGKDFKGAIWNSYIGFLMKGNVQVVDIPDDDQLPELTQTVINNNFKFTRVTDPALAKRQNNPIPLYPGEKESPIKHIVFISKENRTYDEIFGQIEGARGYDRVARYGENVTVWRKMKFVRHVTVAPNHLALAREFALGDNFYVDSDVSADGHRWLVNTYPNEWVESTTPANYGGNRYYKNNSKAPGIFSFTGAAGAIYPEDYNEAGSLWDHLERNHVSFYNFGFSIMLEPAIYNWKTEYKRNGILYFINYPVPNPVFENTSRKFPTFNMGIPDQFRVDRFIEEFNEKWMNGQDSMPLVGTVILPNDHGAGVRKEGGFPFHSSYMADNDLAVGRIVEFLSHTPYWKNMLIVITEDDAQGGVDHVDAHRSVLMMISPWVKRHYVGHEHYSFGSIFKTFYNILGLPYLNQYDAGATDLGDFFTDQPDFTPYHALEVDKRIFDPQKALDPFDKDFDWKAVENSRDMDDVEDMINDRQKEKRELKERRK